MRAFHVIRTNCDCSSNIMVRTHYPNWMTGPRCPGCHKILGPMQWTFDTIYSGSKKGAWKIVKGGQHDNC